MPAEATSAAEFVPASRSLATLRRLVGEQPGDREDVEGKPFVGPAGGILARALEAAELDPGDVYLTNAVKHFKWRGRGMQALARSGA